MRLVLAFFCLIGTNLLRGSSAHSEQDLTGNDLFSDSLPCLGPKIQGLIYTFETYLLKNPAIKTGCDTRFENGTMLDNSGSRFKRNPSRVLRYYVRDDDADGQDLDISPGGFVMLSNGNNSVADTGKTRYDFHQICFPKNCYLAEIAHMSDYKFYCERPNSRWEILAKPIGVEILGRTNVKSMVYIKCEQNGTTFPITSPSLPAGLSEKLLEYDEPEFSEPHLSFEYQMRVNIRSPYWVKCVLRKPLHTPNITLRTFFYGTTIRFLEWENFNMISASQVMSLQNGNVTNGQDKLPAEVRCFPHQCLMTAKTTCDYAYLDYKVALHRSKSQTVTLAHENYDNVICPNIYTIYNVSYSTTPEKTETIVITDPDHQYC